MWGDEFEALYEKYEREGKARKTMPAQDLWFQILTAQVETGKLLIVVQLIVINCDRTTVFTAIFIVIFAIALAR